MRTFIGLALAAAALAAANPTASDDTPSLQRSEEYSCEEYYGSHGLLSPKNGDVVKPGVPFEFGFCSDAYFKTSTREIWVGFNNGKGKLNLLAYNLGPGGYHRNFTFDSTQFGTGELVVHESQNGYNNRYNWNTYSVQLTKATK